LLRTFRQRADAGSVGGRLIFPDGRLQEAGQVVFADGTTAKVGRGSLDPDAPEFTYLHQVDCVSGALLATRRELFQLVGGLESDYGFGFGEDADYAFKLRDAGYQTYLQPDSVVVHAEGASAGTGVAAAALRQQSANSRLFRSRWQHKLRDQPPAQSAFSDATVSAFADRKGR
jgi:GT2 family glycosyltransferase